MQNTRSTSEGERKRRGLVSYLISTCVLILSSSYPSQAQTQASIGNNNSVGSLVPVISLLLDEPSDPPIPPLVDVEYRLPDTGLLVGGSYPSGNNNNCSGETISQQTCSHGRDKTHNEDSDGRAGFSYTKLSAAGAPLEADATEWACVRDNITGFFWEVKTTGDDAQNAFFTFEWGGITAIGRDHPERKGAYKDDWNVLVNLVNDKKLCGFDDWRVPELKELTTLIDWGSTGSASIDADYFPNTKAFRYWSATPAADDEDEAHRVSFKNGSHRTWDRTGQNSSYHVRLIRTNDYRDFNDTAKLGGVK